ncbi:pentapeptide repeat-containing protein [Arthrobacter sp. Sa2CUA1]|uniref:Pentapeptide repeat-containing protein n=1 Tax=Arthrobacter gallicola TaxID=2762225 RepID=A0ABR8UNV0_9MICC|nr:pentapeptide repeat-containing protein [Arthrobacter gallicola]MBD7994203.1 pentapeptide repeat-containing protein [Arthrobacter gallicola]
MARKDLPAPRISSICLPDLFPGNPEFLRAHGQYDGESYADADLAGRLLDGISFSECELIGTQAHGTSLRNARLLDTRVERLNAPVLTAPGLVLRDVSIEASRIGSAEAFSAEWNAVSITGSKLDFLNLRGAVLRDVSFSDCVIGELDLGGAKLTRASFTNTRIDSLQLDGATLEHVDLRGASLSGISGIGSLRGATLSSLQLAEFASTLAEHLGISIRD